MTNIADGWIERTQTLDPEIYDRYRPEYPDELFSTIQEYYAVSTTTRCLEIGIGTGQATESFLKAGCAVTALEPAANLSAHARQKYASRFNLEVREYRFEDIPADEQFDLIYAATSFHWVKNGDRMQMLRSHLEPNGCVALFWNHPAPVEPMHEELRDVYRSVLPHDPKQSEKSWDVSEAGLIADELRAAGFGELQTQFIYRDRVLSTEEYLGLLHTYSDHLSQPDEIRIPLLAGIGAVIDAYGGSITIHDTIDLHLARNT